MVAHASASQNVAPPGHSPSHGSSPASGAMDEKENRGKTRFQAHLLEHGTRTRLGKTSIELDSPTMVACPLNAESRPPRCARGAPTAGTPTSFPSAASAPSPITAGPARVQVTQANTPCATRAFPGANTRANSANATGNDRKVQNAVDIDQVERCIFYAGPGKGFPGIASENEGDAPRTNQPDDSSAPQHRRQQHYPYRGPRR